MDRKLESMLSLCQRAGLLVSGEGPGEAAIKSGKGKLTLLSNEASKNTVKKFTNSSNYYNVPVYIIDATKQQLGGVIGKGERAVIVVCDEGFKRQINAIYSLNRV